jgi:hypothetical protein
MKLLSRATTMKTAMDLFQVAREFVDTVNALHAANNQLQEYLMNHAQEIPLELGDIIIRMNNAVVKFQ